MYDYFPQAIVQLTLPGRIKGEIKPNRIWCIGAGIQEQVRNTVRQEETQTTQREREWTTGLNESQTNKRKWGAAGVGKGSDWLGQRGELIGLIDGRCGGWYQLKTQRKYKKWTKCSTHGPKHTQSKSKKRDTGNTWWLVIKQNMTQMIQSQETDKTKATTTATDHFKMLHHNSETF